MQPGVAKENDYGNSPSNYCRNKPVPKSNNESQLFLINRVSLALQLILFCHSDRHPLGKTRSDFYWWVEKYQSSVVPSGAITKIQCLIVLEDKSSIILLFYCHITLGATISQLIRVVEPHGSICILNYVQHGVHDFSWSDRILLLPHKP